MAYSTLVLAVAATLIGNAQALYSNTTTAPVDFTSDDADYTDFSEVGVYAKCPNYNFGWKSQGHSAYPDAAGQITSGISLGDNAYEVVFQFNGKDCPPVSNLDQAAIIGVESPEASTYLLHDSNQKIARIDDACNWAARFVVNGKRDGNTVCVPPFQIHYSWFSGLAESDYASTFDYNNAYEYSMNCVHDNNNNAQSDFSQYCFELDGTLPEVDTSAGPSQTAQPTATPQSCVSTWGQCGGFNWEAPLECCEGSVCVYSNDYFSQCIPKELANQSSESSTIEPATTSSVIATTESTEFIPTSTISITSAPYQNSTITDSPSPTGPFQSLYGQCGGINWEGATDCTTNAVCSSMNPFYYQCVAGPTPTTTDETTTDSAVQTVFAELYYQCGGINWEGATACATGICSSMNPYYHQCVNTAAWF